MIKIVYTIFLLVILSLQYASANIIDDIGDWFSDNDPISNKSGEQIFSGSYVDSSNFTDINGNVSTISSSCITNILIPWERGIKSVYVRQYDPTDSKVSVNCSISTQLNLNEYNLTQAELDGLALNIPYTHYTQFDEQAFAYISSSKYYATITIQINCTENEKGNMTCHSGKVNDDDLSALNQKLSELGEIGVVAANVAAGFGAFGISAAIAVGTFAIENWQAKNNIEEDTPNVAKNISKDKALSSSIAVLALLGIKKLEIQNSTMVPIINHIIFN